jgi:ArsR family transcriptional regulator
MRNETRVNAVRQSRKQGLPEVDRSAVVRCPPVAAGPVGDIAAKQVAAKLQALAYPARVKLISLLLSNPAGEECGRVLASKVGLPETTVSRALGQLRHAGFIESQRRGAQVYHRPRRAALAALSASLDPYTELDAITEARAALATAIIEAVARGKLTDKTDVDSVVELLDAILSDSGFLGGHEELSSRAEQLRRLLEGSATAR